MMKEDYKQHRKNYLFLTVIALFCLGISIMLNWLAQISFGQTALFFAVGGCLIALASIEYTRYLIKKHEEKKTKGD